MTELQTNTARPTILPALRIDSILVQLALIVSAAFVSPAASHLTGLPVRSLLPMHWPVILAGLCYGWRSGLAIGVAAPVVSFAFSGMPPVAILPAMTVELATYGFVAGFLRERLSLNGHISAIASVVTGRVVFLSIALLIGSIATGFGEYLVAAMLPGIPAAIGQVILLPIVAKWWVDSRRTAQEKDRI